MAAQPVRNASIATVPITDWRSLVGASVSAETSLLLRYYGVFDTLGLQDLVGEEDLTACSLREGARIFTLGKYKGVEIALCDESTLMATGTYKDLDACLVTAVARRARLNHIVVSSGGNLGYALSAYGKHSGVNLFFFHPKSTLYKLDAANFDWGGVKLISVDLPEKAVKSLSLAFAKFYGLTHVPDVRWRLAASAVRALFILEMTQDQRIDCMAQTLCAGFGPAGIYNCFSELSRAGLVRRMEIPRFLGFQQAANSPMVKAWKEGDREIRDEHVNPSPKEMIEPGLYNTNPQGNYTRLFELMRYYGGDMAPITYDDYATYLDPLVGMLREHQLELTRIPGGTDILEKTGVLTGVGILKAIDEGLLRPGERVLYLMTGGFRKVDQPKAPVADMTIDGARSEEDWIRHLGTHFNLHGLTSNRRTELRFRSDLEK
jgi:hypothetical protein